MKKKNDTDNNDDNDVLDITRKFYSLIIITMQKHQDLSIFVYVFILARCNYYPVAGYMANSSML